ncbi:MAG TPA: hypothetical protein VD962_07425 [Rubricoccaceae bacterium]|nr:hypothetical protein [Rubricoccaceae bacterium]
MRPAPRLLALALRAALPFGVFVGALVLAGCFQTRSILRLNADGSGTIEETVTFSPSFLAMVQGFASDSTGTSLPLYSDSLLQARAASLGARFVSVEPYTGENGEEGYRARYAFDDVNALTFRFNEDLLAFANDEENDDTDLPQAPILFTYERGPVNTLRVLLPQGIEDAEEPGEIDSDSLRAELARTAPVLRMIFTDMRIAFDVEVNGTITETDADYHEGNTVTINDVDMGAAIERLLEDPEAFARLRTQAEPSPTSIRRLVGDIEGVRAEADSAVTIRFTE